MTAKALPMKMVTAVPSGLPPSFGGDLPLFGFNLFLMTAIFFLGLMLAYRQASRIWQQRRYDHPLDPVSLYRIITLLAATGLTLRCGAEAMLLWGWDPGHPDTTARIIMAKRWIDPISVWCAFMWMSIVVLGEPGIEHQLRKAPLPVDMWSRWPMLIRALGVVLLSLVMALAAVILR
jgi:hypothetical protein